MDYSDKRRKLDEILDDFNVVIGDLNSALGTWDDGNIRSGIAATLEAMDSAKEEFEYLLDDIDDF